VNRQFGVKDSKYRVTDDPLFTKLREPAKFWTKKSPKKGFNLDDFTGTSYSKAAPWKVKMLNRQIDPMNPNM